MSRRTFWKIATPFVRLAHRLGWCSYYWVNITIGAWRTDLFDELWHYRRYGTPITELPSEVNLCGCAYRTSVAEGTVVFSEDSGVGRSRIVFERDPHDPHAQMWYMEISNKTAAAHITAATCWVNAVFGGSHELRKAAA